MERKTRRRVLKGLFGLSLALNLMVIGIVLSVVFLRGQDDGRNLPGGMERGTFGLIAMLPPEGRDAFRDGVIAENRVPRDERRALIMADRAALIAELEQPIASPSRLVELLSSPRKRGAVASAQIEQALAQFLANMPLDQRLKYIKRLEEISDRPPDRGPDKPHHDKQSGDYEKRKSP